MKLWKHSLISAFTFLGIATTVLYTSCQDDSCTRLTCRNGGSCSEGYCRCPTGYEGSECQNKISARFVGYYYGITQCNEDPPIVDSAYINVIKQPNQIEIAKFSSPDMYTGTINAASNSVVIDDQGNGVLVTVTVENGKANFYVEKTASDGTKNTCRFVGSIKQQ